ncbi:nucleotidyltransferase family protein [Microbacterium sufflavum]|uniref:Nucleotidyltransferase family protein n=1 Tax=Microbacterium sufflavum TaxID=2851649 RepID=A0ABY4IEU6_9MICO|nr:nucleotidyltransferase family protein [Microbacterium sufflavum]MCK2026501.1 nucleotidyltransferase family protein [Microbacterium sufflavum]UPL11297.1 nucleotidyltransferase family protein [Microbacterium sufflavum]
MVQLQEMGLAAGAGTSSSAPLTLSEPWLDSVFHELVYALVARVAEENDIPLLFIKGPTLHAQGLRSRKHSGDVDCWVRPGDDLRLARAMREWGWTPLMLPFTGTTVTHSLTLVAGEWGCAIDVHTSFPGMRLAPGEALQFLLDGAEHRSYAGVSAQTPSLAAHAVLSALHDMRPFEGAPPSAHAVASATAVLATAGDAVFDVIDRLDAGYVLREPLERAFGAQARRFESALPPKDWEMRFERTSSARNFKALKFVPLRMRLRALVRLVWPTAETTRIALSRPQASNAEVFAARIRRVGTSARKLLDGR